MHKFVAYVNDQNNKDIEDDGTLINLVDQNYWDIKGIKQDNALRNFQKRTSYSEKKVADIYRDAKSMGFLERRDSSNSTHAQGVVIVLTDDGRHFLDTAWPFNWKRGRWHAVVKYYGSWSIALSLLALLTSVVMIIKSD